MPYDTPTVSSVTESSAVITRNKIIGVPDELSDYYQYVIEYKKETAVTWTAW